MRIYNPRMATFIDDQGGTGWTPRSHRHFRLTASWLPTANVDAFQEAIRDLRARLSIRGDFEFKYATTHRRPEWRTAFYGCARDLGLRFTTCALNKMRIRPGSIQLAMFFQVCATVLSVNLRATFHEAEAARCAAEGMPILLREPVVVDDNKDPLMLSAIEEAFRALRSARDPHEILTNKPEFRNSEKDERVQLADMIMGAVGEHLDGEDSQWYNLIRKGGRDLGVVELSGCAGQADDLSENKVSRDWYPGSLSLGTQSTA